jgi:hypothetical protein
MVKAKNISSKKNVKKNKKKKAHKLTMRPPQENDYPSFKRTMDVAYPTLGGAWNNESQRQGNDLHHEPHDLGYRAAHGYDDQRDGSDGRQVFPLWHDAFRLVIDSAQGVRMD